MTKKVIYFENSTGRVKTSHLILYREIIAVCSQIHTKHVNTPCGQNVELWMLNWRYILWPLDFKGLNLSY